MGVFKNHTMLPLTVIGSVWGILSIRAAIEMEFN